MPPPMRSEEHTSELQSLMRKSYAVFCLKKKKTTSDQSSDANHQTQYKTLHEPKTYNATTTTIPPKKPSISETYNITAHTNDTVHTPTIHAPDPPHTRIDHTPANN